MGLRRSFCSAVLGLAVLSPSTLTHGESFSEWKSRQQQQTDDWVSEQQKAFADMLRSEWEAFTSHLSRREGYQPKPEAPPSVQPVSPAPEPEQPAPEPVQPPEPERPAEGQLQFLGHLLSPPAGTTDIPDRYSDSQTFADAWEALARSPETAALVSWLEKQREALNLGDWGVWKLVRAVSTGNQQQQAVRSWYLLLALGYDVKLGFNNQRVAVLPRVRQTIYWKQYYTSSGHRYYDLTQQESRPDQLFLHGQTGDDRQPMDLSFSKQPLTSPQPRSISLKDSDHTLRLEFDARLADFYRQHPTIDLVHYFEAPLDPLLEKSLQQAWDALDQSALSELERLNRLLGLVQHGVTYQLDNDLFGIEEYYQLPGELLLNGAGDCEDRSILFARLGRQLLNREIVGVRYPGHVATAVQLEAPGISYVLDNQRYLVADPTYIGSMAGEAIPDLADEQPELIF